jgi:NACalpha-BTF3-like transcription factor
MNKLKNVEVRKVGGSMRRAMVRKKNTDTEDKKLWTLVNKLDTKELMATKVFLINEDKTSVEISNPKIKKINKSFTSIIYDDEKTTTKFNNEDVLNLPTDEETKSELKSKDLKNKKLLSKVKLIPVNNIDKILVKSFYLDFIIHKPQVYRLEKKLLYVIYGELKAQNISLDSKTMEQIQSQISVESINKQDIQLSVQQPNDQQPSQPNDQQPNDQQPSQPTVIQ